jgi:hypothetical protein
MNLDSVIYTNLQFNKLGMRHDNNSKLTTSTHRPNRERMIQSLLENLQELYVS